MIQVSIQDPPFHHEFYLCEDLKKNWLVVSTPLKNISQNGNLPQVGMKIKHIWNHHLESISFPSSDCDNLVFHRCEGGILVWNTVA